MNWMENIRDWCISRQLWWGHRVPVWYCTKPDCDGMIVALEDPAPGTACPKCGCTELHQDDDVLDTWFSSALWPFSTLGWPQQTDALKTFYPTTIMETGFDILFFWVARMMMMGIHFMGDVPFYTVYLHAMVRDQHGEDVETKGNVLIPWKLSRKLGLMPCVTPWLPWRPRGVTLSYRLIASWVSRVCKQAVECSGLFHEP